MRCSALVLCGLTLASSVLPSATAEACGALPEGQHGLSASQPLDGAVDVPRDAVLTFGVDCQSESPELDWAVCQINRGLLVVTLSPTSTDQPSIGGSTEAFGDSQVWVPSAPLLPNETYLVDVRLAEDVLSYEGAQTSLSFSFTTGEERLTALSSKGVQQRAEYYDAPVADCTDRKVVGDSATAALDPKAICPTGFGMCEAAGTQRAVRLAVRFSALTGGAAALGYVVRMMETDVVPGNFESLPGGGEDTQWADEPHDLLLGRASHVAMGTAGELTLDLLRPEREDGDETVCVRAIFMDAGGRFIGPEPVCKDYDAWLSDADALEEKQNEEDESAADTSKPDAGTRDEDAGAEAADASSSAPVYADDSAEPATAQAGCAAHGGHAGTAGWLLALALWALAWRRVAA